MIKTGSRGQEPVLLKTNLKRERITLNFLRKVSQIIDSFTDKIGLIVAWLTTILVLNVFYDVIMRYAFHHGNIAVQEMEWHIFSVIFLIGAAYTLKEDGHVRVDIIYTKLSNKQKAWIDFLGTFVFLIPFCIIVIYASLNFIEASWAVREVSPDPGGLPGRYVLKAMIPLGFLLLIIQGISQAIKNLLVITGHEKEVK
ncbi:MAG: TRAP transporter small permease subunit [Deltaproteobacteria bacterium]|nr:TRAP transporter small permease subunit [Deltaproteobacteria bacterium]